MLWRYLSHQIRGAHSPGISFYNVLVVNLKLEQTCKDFACHAYVSLRWSNLLEDAARTNSLTAGRERFAFRQGLASSSRVSLRAVSRVFLYVSCDVLPGLFVRAAWVTVITSDCCFVLCCVVRVPSLCSQGNRRVFIFHVTDPPQDAAHFDKTAKCFR